MFHFEIKKNQAIKKFKNHQRSLKIYLPTYSFDILDIQMILQYGDKVPLRDCINQKLFSRAIVAYHKILIFIKGTLHNQQKKIQRMNGPTILDGLHNSRCGSFCCVRIILDDAIICMDKHTRISSFFTFWAT